MFENKYKIIKEIKNKNHENNYGVYTSTVLFSGVHV